jgi:hypothetical protein
VKSNESGWTEHDEEHRELPPADPVTPAKRRSPAERSASVFGALGDPTTIAPRREPLGARPAVRSRT